MTASKTISLIAIHYKNVGQTQNFIDDFLRCSKGQGGVRLFVVDNGENPGLEKFVNKTPSGDRVIVVHPPTNRGYFGGAAWLVQEMPELARGGIVIVCNTDLEFADPLFFEKLSRMSHSSEIAVLGPALISKLSCQDTNPYMRQRPTEEKMRFLKRIFASPVTCQLYQLAGLMKAKLKARSRQKSLQEEEVVYAVHGGFMIFLPSYFAAGGNFKHPVFLYNEELYVAEFCRRSGLKTLYVPSLQLVHREHGSIGLFYSKKILGYKAEAARYFADHYWNSI